MSMWYYTNKFKVQSFPLQRAAMQRHLAGQWTCWAHACCRWLQWVGWVGWYVEEYGVCLSGAMGVYMWPVWETLRIGQNRSMRILQSISAAFEHCVFHGLHGKQYRIPTDPLNVNTSLVPPKWMCVNNFRETVALPHYFPWSTRPSSKLVDEG